MMIYKTFFLRTLFSIILLLNLISITWGQTNNYNKEQVYKNFFRLSGFSDDNRVKLLILNLLPSGLTEVAADEITKVLQLNIFNTIIFQFWGHQNGILK